jgi:sulfur carrier protein ThiS
MIHIKLTGEFIKLAPSDSEKGMFDVEFETGMTLSALVDRLGIKDTGIKYTVLVNKARKSADYVFSDSDSITVMPLLAGG